jgi:predicted aspartyl protease
MITGAVKSDEARIRLKVIGGQRREQEVEAVIDTGFTGALTLPPALITRLGLRWRSVDRATLADGSTCVFQVYAQPAGIGFCNC